MNLKTIFLAATLIATRALAAEQTADPYMGDWEGTVTIAGQKKRVAVYMIPLGTFNYEARFVADFNQRGPFLHRLRGEFQSSFFSFMDDIPFDVSQIKGTTDKGVVLDASLWSGSVYYETLKSRVPEPGFYVRRGSISGRLSGQFELQKTQRLSPLLNKQVPAGGVVLFDGKNLDQWQTRDGKPAGWKLLPEGVMEVKGGDIVSTEKFSDFQLHLEFCLPYMPHELGQARANSGVYLQTRYEVQVLDSYGLEGLDNECGGFYQISRPLVNMCAPPLQWQSYDITFHSAKLGATGGKIANASVTVIHNGVKIHDNFELTHVTPGGMNTKEGVPAGLLLQDHGNPVQYRNIWVIRL